MYPFHDITTSSFVLGVMHYCNHERNSMFDVLKWFSSSVALHRRNIKPVVKSFGVKLLLHHRCRTSSSVRRFVSTVQSLFPYPFYKILLGVAKDYLMEILKRLFWISQDSFQFWKKFPCVCLMFVDCFLVDGGLLIF